jgi:hypothetical protein
MFCGVSRLSSVGVWDPPGQLAEQDGQHHRAHGDHGEHDK